MFEPIRTRPTDGRSYLIDLDAGAEVVVLPDRVSWSRENDDLRPYEGQTFTVLERRVDTVTIMTPEGRAISGDESRFAFADTADIPKIVAEHDHWEAKRMELDAYIAELDAEDS